jgi:hypothetical protein
MRHYAGAACFADRGQRADVPLHFFAGFKHAAEKPGRLGVYADGGCLYIDYRPAAADIVKQVQENKDG